MFDDAMLVKRTLAGDEQAFAQLVERYKGSVYALCLQFAPTIDDAQELTQEAFFKAYLSLPTLKDRHKFGAWLLRIAANCCKMHVRKKSPRFVNIDRLESNELAITSEFLRFDEAAYRNIELRDLLDKALQSLTSGEKQVYTLYFLDTFTYREIAKALDVPIGTVKRRLHQVRQKMQKEILIMTSEHGILKHHVGIEVAANKERTLQKLGVFFQKNTPIPASISHTFTTAEDNQGSIDIHVLEGEDENNLAACRSLGRLRVRYFSIAPAGVPQIRLNFAIDENGLLTISATEPPDKPLDGNQREPMKVTVEKSL